VILSEEFVTRDQGVGRLGRHERRVRVR